MPRALVLPTLLLAACGGAQPPGDPDPAAPDAATASGPDGGLAADQVPPTGRAALEAWLATGAYQAWSCEDAPHPARPPGAHGENRICSNAAIAGTPAGALPVGAASVKELYEDGHPNGYAVAIKLEADSAGGDGWYWFENLGGTIYADGAGVSLCTGCHAGGDDYVFTRVP